MENAKVCIPAGLAGRHVVVTAGGCREPIDPIRFIGNRSSGKMGFAVDTNRISVLHASGKREDLPLMSKHAVAHEIISRVLPLLDPRDRDSAG